MFLKLQSQLDGHDDGGVGNHDADSDGDDGLGADGVGDHIVRPMVLLITVIIQPCCSRLCSSHL